MKQKFNPTIHHRRSVRLKGYDYSQSGAYFITICCRDMICFFGEIKDDEMILNECGKIAYDEWAKLSVRYSNFELDVFQIMPNHLHGIIVLNDEVDQPQEAKQIQGIAPTVGDIVGAYKSLVFNGCLEIYKCRNEIMGKLWQRNYYEHIIRNEKSYRNISHYFINNPSSWKDDKFFKP